MLLFRALARNMTPMTNIECLSPPEILKMAPNTGGKCFCLGHWPGTCFFNWSYTSLQSLLFGIIISTDEDPSLRIESCAIINLRGVSTKWYLNLIFTMQSYKELISNAFILHRYFFQNRLSLNTETCFSYVGSFLDIWTTVGRDRNYHLQRHLGEGKMGQHLAASCIHNLKLFLAYMTCCHFTKNY